MSRCDETSFKEPFGRLMREARQVKYIIAIGDGMADLAQPSLRDETPLSFAHTPCLDRLARRGRVGSTCLIPPGCAPGRQIVSHRAKPSGLNTVKPSPDAPSTSFCCSRTRSMSAFISAMHASCTRVIELPGRMSWN